MGLLGQKQNPFLATRMFDIFDLDNDDFITFTEFARLMDLLVNGDDNERN
jgi:Ca2+-binding EF-hand superfamily protein